MNSQHANGNIHYLTTADLYHINLSVTHGHTFVRDVHLLDSAMRRPQIIVFGEEQFRTPLEKAAALLHSLAYHHLFADGNKRTALVAVTLFLAQNGLALTWNAATQQAFILEVAKGTLDVEQIAVQLGGYLIAL
ncbi:MAG: type II toxin-antitoxin system death-on-curing family toxin [Phototrophicaceae bacterium]|jgi:death-on-curing protein